MRNGALTTDWLLLMDAAVLYCMDPWQLRQRRPAERSGCSFEKLDVLIIAGLRHSRYS